MKKILFIVFLFFAGGNCSADILQAALPPRKISISNISKNFSKTNRERPKGISRTAEKSVLEDQSQDYTYYDISFRMINRADEDIKDKITVITRFFDKAGDGNYIKPLKLDWAEKREIPGLEKKEKAVLFASHCYNDIELENYRKENKLPLEFGGFTVSIYLNGELEDEFAHPAELLQIFPSPQKQKSLTPYKNPAKTEPETEKKETGVKVIHDFSSEKTGMKGVSGSYQNSPSRITCRISSSAAYNKGTGKGLEIWYDKKNEGGKFGKGGFCGYFLLLTKHPKSENRNITDIKFFDASKYKYITFMVKAYAGDENFKIGIADQMHAVNDDSYKSDDVINYTAGGSIGRDWQKVKIPLSDFFVDTRALYAVSICFEGSCFPDGVSSGKILIDEIQFEK